MALKLYVEVKPVFERVSEDFGLFMGRWLRFFYEEDNTQNAQALNSYNNSLQRRTMK